MAKDKKSFILYTDMIHSFSILPDDIAGKLIKTIFEYVNDKDPQPEDLLVKVAFEPIKQQLKRDLKDWDNERERRSESGKRGGLKSGEARRRSASKNEGVLQKTKQTEANEAVTVTVNVNDTTTTIDRQKVLEYLRGAAPIGTERAELEVEADALMKTYGGKKIGNLRALCNRWMANFAERAVMPVIQPVKKMVL